MDIADQAQCIEERLRERQVAAARTRGQPRDAADGACRNCGAPVAAGRRWCDADCRDDWTHRSGGRP